MIDRTDELVEAVRKIASERPDVVSDIGSCCYITGECSDGSEGCLIGQALRSIDWPLYEANRRYKLCIDKLLLDSGCPPSKNAEWCLGVQKLQDGGFSWSVSVKRADINVHAVT